MFSVKFKGLNGEDVNSNVYYVQTIPLMEKPQIVGTKGNINIITTFLVYDPSTAPADSMQRAGFRWIECGECVPTD